MEINLSVKILNLSWEDGFKGKYIKEEDVKEAFNILLDYCSEGYRTLDQIKDKIKEVAGDKLI
jgi:hypothetical protein